MVTTLNSYYKIFDDSMNKYQVYKVNCVNDSHMIVSGLPPSETDHHVTQIASMALNILANGNKWGSSILDIDWGSHWPLSRFVVSHRPYERLKLRAGINTGPVIAGVQSVGQAHSDKICWETLNTLIVRDQDAQVQTLRRHCPGGLSP